jgi:hypothetical protein
MDPSCNLEVCCDRNCRRVDEKTDEEYYNIHNVSII